MFLTQGQSAGRQTRPAHSGHAHLIDLNRSGRTSRSRSQMPLRQRVTVFISTAPFDGEASPRKSNCWLLRCVGPEQAKQLLFHASVVTKAVDEDAFSESVDMTPVE